MKQRSTTSLGYALLGLVHLQPQSGYDLRKVFETTPLGHYSSSPGAIYPALKRLEEMGLISGEVAGGDTLRPKRIYSSTPAGVTTLREWVSQAITKDDFHNRDDELMLRFALMGSVVDDETTFRFLEQMLEILDDYIPDLNRIRAEMPNAGPPHGRLALTAGIEMYKTRRRWVRTALAEFGPDNERGREK